MEDRLKLAVPAWQAYGELFAAVQEKRGWLIEDLVAAYNDYVGKQIPPRRKCFRRLRSFEGWKTPPTSPKSKRAPRAEVKELLFRFLRQELDNDPAYNCYLEAVAPLKERATRSSEMAEDDFESISQAKGLIFHRSGVFAHAHALQKMIYSQAEMERLTALLEMPVRELELRMAEISAKSDEDKLRRLKERERELITPELISAFLTRYYREPSNSEFGRYTIAIGNKRIETPIFVRPSDLRLALPAERINFKLVKENRLHPSKIPDALKGRVIEYAFRLRRSGVIIKNKPLYRLIDEELEKRRISFSEIDFFAYRFNSGLLQDELYDVIRECDGDPSLLKMNRGLLPLREHLLPDLGRLANPSARICAGGIGVLFAVKEGDHYTFPLQVRSRKVGDGRGFHALLPKSFHGGFNDSRIEKAIQWTVFRELYKEMYEGKREDYEDPRKAHDWYFAECEAMKWFEDNKEKYRMDVVAFGFNAISGNYDFGILLVIKDPKYRNDFCRRAISYNWEPEKPFWISTHESDTIKDLLENESWAPESLYHFVEALLHLKSLDGNAVKSPKIERFVGNARFDR